MEERELIAFTAMSKQEYEELKKAQEVKIAKKLREAKNTEDGKFNPDEWNVPIIKKIVFNIDGIFHLEGECEFHYGTYNNKMHIRVPGFEQIYLRSPFSNEEEEKLDIMDLVFSKIKKETESKNFKLEYSDNPSINFLDEFKRYIYEENAEANLEEIETGENLRTTLFLRQLTEMANTDRNTIVINKVGYLIEAYAINVPEDRLYHSFSYADFNELEKVKSLYSIDEIFEDGLLSEPAFTTMVKNFSKEKSFSGMEKYLKMKYKAKQY